MSGQDYSLSVKAPLHEKGILHREKKTKLPINETMAALGSTAC